MHMHTYTHTRKHQLLVTRIILQNTFLHHTIINHKKFENSSFPSDGYNFIIIYEKTSIYTLEVKRNKMKMQVRFSYSNDTQWIMRNSRNVKYLTLVS